MAEINKQAIIPGHLTIFNQVKRGKPSAIWTAKVYLHRTLAPMKSLKTEDKKAAVKLAIEFYNKITAQYQSTGSVGTKTLRDLVKDQIESYELMHKSGRKGGSLPNLNRQRNALGKFLLAFCDYKGIKNPSQLAYDNFSSEYIIWREEHGWEKTGINPDGSHTNGANTRKIIPQKSTIFNELQTIRKFSEDQLVPKYMQLAIRIPKRKDVVPPPDPDKTANPPFLPSDYKKITAAFRRWIKAKNGYDIRTKKVIYQFFLITCSTGWRYDSEGLCFKWSGVKGFRTQINKIKGEEIVNLISKIDVWDSKRKCWRKDCEIVNAQHIINLQKMYQEWSSMDRIFPTTGDIHMFIDPATGKRITGAQVYDIFKKHILADCNLDRKDYTYYSTRKYMVTQRILNGADPAVLAKWTGHDPKILYTIYLDIHGQKVPESNTQMKFPESTRQDQWMSMDQIKDTPGITF